MKRYEGGRRGPLRLLLLANRSRTPILSSRYSTASRPGIVRFLSWSRPQPPMLPQLLDLLPRGESPYELLMLRYNGVIAVPRRMLSRSFPQSGRSHDHDVPGTLGSSARPENARPAKHPSAPDGYRYSMSHPASTWCFGPGRLRADGQAIRGM